MDAFAVTLMVGIPIALIIGVLKAVAGSTNNNLRKKFIAAGNLKGKTKAEIISLVGPPGSVSAQAHGKSLLQWMRTSSTGAYHIGLLFDADGRVEKVTHEHANGR